MAKQLFLEHAARLATDAGQGLSAAEGGLMASDYAFGYMLAVPVLTTLTDRIDARAVLLCGSIVSRDCFGFFAEGFWSATAIWCLAGIGFAGGYMPGLRP